MEPLPRVRLAVYFTTRCLLQAEREKNLSHILRYFQTYGCCDKVYLESYRDGRALDDTVLREAKQFFEANGVKTAGALTATCLHRKKSPASFGRRRCVWIWWGSAAGRMGRMAKGRSLAAIYAVLFRSSGAFIFATSGGTGRRVI